MIKLEKLDRMLGRKFLRLSLSEWCVISAICAYAAVFSAYTIFKHVCFQTYAADLGIFYQALWSTCHGKLLYETPDMLRFNTSGCFLATHFAPILLVLVPLFALFPRAETLLILQSLVIASAAFPLSRIAKEMFGESAGLFVGLSYLLYFPIHGANCYDFHLEAFVPLFVALAIYYYERRDFRKCLLSMTFLWATMMEVTSLFAAFIALSWLVREGFSASRSRFAIAFLVASVVLAGLAHVFMSFFGPPINVERAASNFSIDYLFSDSGQKFLYWVLLIVPLCGFCLLSPSNFLMVVLWLGMTAFVRPFHASWYSLGWQYPLLVVSQLFFASLYGIKNLAFFVKKKWGRDVKDLLLVALLCSSVISAGFLSPLNPSMRGSLRERGRIFWGEGYNDPRYDEHTELLHTIVRYVPEGASVLTQANIFPHVCRSFYAYVNEVPEGLPENVDYILLDIKEGCSREVFPALSELVNRYEYGILAYADGILLLKKDYRGDPIVEIPYDNTFSWKELYVKVGSLEYEVDSTSGLVFTHRPEDPGGTLWFGPYCPLLPGKYEVIVRLRVTELAGDVVCKIRVYSVFGTMEEFAVQEVRKELFQEVGEWENFTFVFELEHPCGYLEIVGECEEGVGLQMDFVRVRQLEVWEPCAWSL